MMDCVFCREEGGEILWSDDAVRVVLADEPEWPGFCRVIWHAHVAEMSDLDNAARLKVMTAVNGVERAIPTIPVFRFLFGRRASARCPRRCCRIAGRRPRCCAKQCAPRWRWLSAD